MLAVLLAACASSDPRADPGGDGDGDGDSGGAGDGDGDVSGGDGDGDSTTDPPVIDGTDAAVTCTPNPGNELCPEICTEVCNDVDDDCDGEVDEGADDTDCAADNATAICTQGLCVITGCDESYRDCDQDEQNGCEADISGVVHCGACNNTCEADNATVACVDGACEATGCVAPYLDCVGDDGACETFGETLTDCGECGRACGTLPSASPECMGGECVVGECIGNFGDCNGDGSDGCEVQLNMPSNCGACGMGCAFAGSSTSCDTGTCLIESCSAGYADCDGSELTACDSLDSDAHCGGCGLACTVDALMNVQDAGCENRACLVECAPLFGDCDGMDNGCETPLTSNSNCGGCGVSCTPEHATGDCSAGTCGVGQCQSGWADCDGLPDNGCETNTGLPDNCGGCGVVCQPMIGCAVDTCMGVLCIEGEANCDSMDNNGCEVDLSADDSCGSCNTRCEFDQGIDGHAAIGCGVENATPGQMAWGCELSCNSGFADCNGDYRDGCETDLTDVENCNGCGNVCAKAHATPTCENRVCEVDTCSGEWADCDGDDLDCETPLNTANDCGACRAECTFPFAQGQCGGSPGNRACVISACVPSEFDDCNGTLGDGCEVDTSSDPLHCNGCGNDCTGAPQVRSAACVGSSCIYTCDTGYDDCTGAAGCETSLLVPESCGSCDNDCRQLDRVASAGCLPGGGNPLCAINTCDGGYGDCNGDVGDGCETQTDIDASHCGACSGDPGHQPCTGLPGVSASLCTGGTCNIMTCTGTLEDCNGVSADGCEWDPAVDGMCCDPNADADGDGSDDCADQCPSDPGKSAPGVCGCFVADADSDGDGSENCIEECDNDPGKTVPGSCGCGTPDVDGDGDGFLVCDDPCDADPAKQDPGLCGCGTPDVDYPGCIADPWNYEPAQVDHTGGVVVDCAASFNSSNGTWSGCGGDVPTVGLQTPPGGVESYVLGMDSLTVTNAGSIRLTGSRPVIFSAEDDIHIDGRVDASSTFGEPGAGATSSCGGNAGGNGRGDGGSSDGGSGGGGGGYGTSGGNGGSADGGSGGGGGSAVVVADPWPFLGGCTGGAAGAGNASAVDPDAVGGEGGGAVQLSAIGTLTLTANAVVSASGAGGRLGLHEEDGGGGGGSGGSIVLEGSSRMIDGGAAITVNGGGGAAGQDETGSDVTSAADAHGEDGHTDDDNPAAGGRAYNGGRPGGAGASPGNAAQTASSGNGDDGGGGGGGGVGRIASHDL